MIEHLKDFYQLILTYGIDEENFAGILPIHGDQLSYKYLVRAPLVFYLEPQRQRVSYLPVKKGHMEQSSMYCISRHGPVIL